MGRLVRKVIEWGVYSVFFTPAKPDFGAIPRTPSPFFLGALYQN